jgi:ElaB/YqjD/DUF883 family membrane-anchored ribosome-binding protein
MTNDLRAAATNTAYLAVGIGVVTAQQVQRQAESAIHGALERVKAATPKPTAIREGVEAKVTPVVDQVRFFVEPSVDTVRAQAEGAISQAGDAIDQAGDAVRGAREQVEPMLRDAADQVRDAVRTGRERIEPTIDKVRTRIGQTTPTGAPTPTVVVNEAPPAVDLDGPTDPDATGTD